MFLSWYLARYLSAYGRARATRQTLTAIQNFGRDSLTSLFRLFKACALSLVSRIERIFRKSSPSFGHHLPRQKSRGTFFLSKYLKIIKRGKRQTHKGNSWINCVSMGCDYVRENRVAKLCVCEVKSSFAAMCLLWEWDVIYSYVPRLIRYICIFIQIENILKFLN